MLTFILCFLHNFLENQCPRYQICYTSRKNPCVSWFIEAKSATHSQINCRTNYRKNVFSQPHLGRVVCNFRDETFPGLWIGRDAPNTCPFHLPDISPQEFFLWRHVKDSVYQTNMRDITEMKQRIIDIIGTIDNTLLHRTWLEIEYCIGVPRQN